MGMIKEVRAPGGGPPPHLRIPGMVMIGAGGRDCGKTTLACELIRRFSRDCQVEGAKVTTVHERSGRCPRGDDGCGACSSLEGPYRLTQEPGEIEGKDTTRLLDCGAWPVHWLCLRPRHLAEGAQALVRELRPRSLVVCESNSLRRVLEPGLFVIVQRHDQRNVKPSCQAVSHLADVVLRFDRDAFDPTPAAIDVHDGRWTFRRNATGVVLAGGRSRRMGQDKALLPVRGRPMIQHVVERLRPHVSEIVVSAGDPQKYGFLGVTIVPDRQPDQGPMVGIASALAQTRTDINVFVPCDVPDFSIGLLTRMLREARDADIVVPRTPEDRYESLFAVYRRRTLPAIDAALERGERRIITVYPECDTHVIRPEQGEYLVNVNTAEDYEQLLSVAREDNPEG